MTYAVLAGLFLAGGGVLAVVAGRGVRRPRVWWLATLAVGLVLVALTAVFDNLMVAADLFRYDDAALLGPRLLLVPVEDFAWPLFSALVLPALWELVGRVRRGAAGQEEEQ